MRRRADRTNFRCSPASNQSNGSGSSRSDLGWRDSRSHSDRLASCRVLVDGDIAARQSPPTDTATARLSSGRGVDRRAQSPQGRRFAALRRRLPLADAGEHDRSQPTSVLGQRRRPIDATGCGLAVAMRRIDHCHDRKDSYRGGRHLAGKTPVRKKSRNRLQNCRLRRRLGSPREPAGLPENVKPEPCS